MRTSRPLRPVTPARRRFMSVREESYKRTSTVVMTYQPFRSVKPERLVAGELSHLRHFLCLR